MSQQYYYNNAQYTTPTSYAGQSTCYAAVAQPITTGFTPVTTVRTTIGTTYNMSGTPMSSAHRSQAPVTYTYPTNAAVMTQPLGVVTGQQATLVAPALSVGKLGSNGPSFVIANGPNNSNISNNGSYTVTTSYFPQISAQAHAQHQGMAQVVAAAQQANFQVALNVANSTRGRSNAFNQRFPNFRKSAKSTHRSNIDAQVFYCEVCKISCAGPQTYKEHLDGQKHKKKASGSNLVPSTSTNNNLRQLRCELCDVTCTGVDAYQAHIRGSKHQKTLKLHQRLGKPIPCSDPLVLKTANPTDAPGVVGAVSASVEINGDSSNTIGPVQIISAPKINFISEQELIEENRVNANYGTDSSILKTVTPGVTEATVVSAIASQAPTAKNVEEHIDLNALQDKSAAPIGGEYIETTSNENGKVIQFFCKLCNCKFNDPHAKDMHLKGRRHRLQYKRKVDPRLIVDIKSSTNRNTKLEEERVRQKQQREEYWRRRDMQERMREMQRLEYSNVSNVGGYFDKGHHGMRHFDTLDDKYIITKHDSIYPTDEEIQVIQSVVAGCEKALRSISEVLFDEVATELKEEKSDDDNVVTASKDDTKKEVTKAVCEKLLSGAMRVGPLAKSLLLRGELVVSLVLLCSKWPTFSLMDKVVDKLPERLKEILPNDDMEVTLNSEYQCILVSRNKAPEMHCYIHFTSSVVREESSEGIAAVQPEDGLDRKRCLDALASLRHTKWFQAKVTNYQSLTLIRILRDLCQRVSTWSPLSSWAVELLTEKIVSSEPMKMSPGSALRRFFECIASGILLPGGPGLRDPCEKEISDASSVLSDQAREDITLSAQHALRLIAFRQIHTVLDMDPLVTTAAVGTVSSKSVEDKSAGNGRKRRHSEDDNVEEMEALSGGGGSGGCGSTAVEALGEGLPSGAATGTNLKKDKKEEPEVNNEAVVAAVATNTNVAVV